MADSAARRDALAKLQERVDADEPLAEATVAVAAEMDLSAVEVEEVWRELGPFPWGRGGLERHNPTGS